MVFVTKPILQKLEKPAIILAAAAVLTAILVNIEFNLLEANLYDFRMAHGPQPAPSSDIVTIAIDDATVESMNDFSPLPLMQHVKLLEAIEKMHPKAVGYLVDMNRVNQANPEMIKGEWGTRFVSAANRLLSTGVPFLVGTTFDVTGEMLPPYPLNSLPHAVAIVHKDGNVFSEDKTTRRALTTLNDKPVFHLDLAQKLGFASPNHLPRGSFFVPEAGGNYFFFRYHGKPVLPVTKERAKLRLPYKIISFADVLDGKADPSALQGKIVLVGTLCRDDSSDFAFTPYSRSSFANPKLLLHANILNSIMEDDGIRRAPQWLNWIITFAVAVFVLWWVLNSTPLYGVFATLALTTVFIASITIIFATHGFWIKASQPLLAIFAGYYLAVPYRLIREYKKRWDYQRKNEVLVQVEELKTNFLSLVTHDLKTPVARIQGLAEVLLAKAGERLNERDKITVSNIISATDELNRFISSLLELNRIESNRVHLNIESRDVNQIIEKSVEGFKAQARANGLRVVTELEPLFPIKIDVSLLSKVLNNLIDNAIKYSPAASQVSVVSREIGDHVEISVQDQGIGMTEEEQQKLFSKFFRAKNDTTTKIAGTGLGLYLTKFFVEAMNGQVEVKSQKGSGSTFIIRLPIAAAPAKPLKSQNFTDSKENVHVPSTSS
jgi:signal transduction histidine kinase